MIPARNIKRFFQKALTQPGYALRVFKKRIASYLCYAFARGRAAYPEAITLFLTHRCNLRCRMCGQWGENGVTKKMNGEEIKRELSLEELKNFIDDVARFKPNITLFGGEPLLHPYCAGLIKYIKSKGMHCLIITNGSLLVKFADAIVDAGLDELNISLDGKEELHDNLRGMPGLFGRIREGIDKVDRAKKQKRSKKPFINLQCTITKYNYNRLGELPQVAEDMMADSLTFHNLIFLEKTFLENQRLFNSALGLSLKEWEGFVFDPGIDPDALYKEIDVIKKGRHRFPVDIYPNFSRKALREYYLNPSYFPLEYPARCVSPWMTAYVFPDGRVRPCLNFDYTFGNVTDAGFIDIWNGPRAVKYRKSLKDSRIFPVCVRCTELYRY